MYQFECRSLCGPSGMMVGSLFKVLNAHPCRYVSEPACKFRLWGGMKVCVRLRKGMVCNFRAFVE